MLSVAEVSVSVTAILAACRQQSGSVRIKLHSLSGSVAGPGSRCLPDSSLAAVLNSPEALAWRQGLDMTRNEICRRCVCSLALREDPS